MVARFTLVEWKKVWGSCCVDFSRWKNVGKGGIAWNDEREASPRVGEQLNEGEVWYELRLPADSGCCLGLVRGVK